MSCFEVGPIFGHKGSDYIHWIRLFWSLQYSRV